MGQESVFDAVRLAVGEFPQAERKVARALLREGPTAGLESSSKLAGVAGVSGPTVIRFANRLGFGTYAEFQRAVRTELDSRFTSPIDLYPSVRAAGNISEAAMTAANHFADAISETFARLHPRDLELAVTLLSGARSQIRIFGGWFSHALAEHMAGLLQEVRSGVHFVANDAQRRVPAMVEADRRTVAVFFDYRRYEDDLLKIGEAMSKRGVKIILFTDQWLSPMADFADVVLVSSAGEPRPFESYVPALALVETVVSQVVDSDLEGNRQRFEQFNKLAGGLAADTRGQGTVGL